MTSPVEKPARLQEELERTRSELCVLRQVSCELNSTLDLDAIHAEIPAE